MYNPAFAKAMLEEQERRVRRLRRANSRHLPAGRKARARRRRAIRLRDPLRA